MQTDIYSRYTQYMHITVCSSDYKAFLGGLILFYHNFTNKLVENMEEWA